jgi:NAD(P)H-hydrate epimerase
VREIARRAQAVVVLKGQHSLIANPEGFVLINVSGGPILATGGAGDLLTGLIAGLLAQDLAPFEAAALGTFLHGLAANLATERLADRGVFPTEIQAFLPEAWKRVLENIPSIN